MESLSKIKRMKKVPDATHLVYGMVCLMALYLILHSIAISMFYDNPYLRFATPIHIDEYHWYLNTYHYHLFFNERAFDDEHWFTQEAFEQPHIGEYLFGFFLDINGVGINKETDIAEWYRLLERSDDDEEKFKAYLEQNINLPSDALFVGRFYSAVFSYLAMALCVIYMIRVTNPLGGVLLACYLTSLGLFYHTRMMSDSFLIFFFVFGMLLFDYLTLSKKTGEKYFLLLLYSTVAGITVGIKLPGLLMLSFLPSYVIGKFLLEKDRKKFSHDVLLVFIHVLIALSVFAVFSPQTYESPVMGILKFFEYKFETFRIFPFSPSGNVIPRFAGEFPHQIGYLAENMPVAIKSGLSHAHLSIIVSALIILGLLRMFFVKDKMERLRYLPILLTIFVVPVFLSHTQDVKYTWFMTIALAFAMIFGLDYLIINLKRVIGNFICRKWKLV